MTREEELRAEVKLLTAIFADEVFEGRTVRQERPSSCCSGKVVDLFATNVTFRQLIIGKKVFHLIEPSCPTCGRMIKASYTLLV